MLRDRCRSDAKPKVCKLHSSLGFWYDTKNVMLNSNFVSRRITQISLCSSNILEEKC